MYAGRISATKLWKIIGGEGGRGSVYIQACSFNFRVCAIYMQVERWARERFA